MNYTYRQLSGAIGCLQNNGYELNYKELKEKLIKICRRMDCDHNFLQEDVDELSDMHKFYRKICLKNGYIKAGYLFGKDDYAIIE